MSDQIRNDEELFFQTFSSVTSGSKGNSKVDPTYVLFHLLFLRFMIKLYTIAVIFIYFFKHRSIF